MIGEPQDEPETGRPEPREHCDVAEAGDRARAHRRPGSDGTSDSEVIEKKVTLTSTSRSADAGHLSAADIAAIAREAGIEFRLIGGNAISLLVWAHHATELVPGRETNDADLGVPSEAIGAAGLIGALTNRHYQQTEGNRFVRTVEHDGATLELEIDVLVPAYGDRMESNQPFGDLVVDAIPGLAVAIARAPTLVHVTAQLTTGTDVRYAVPLPEPISALCMKAYAYRWRFAQRDALDIWRLLEVARKLGLSQQTWPAGASGRVASQILHQYFGMPASTGPAAATADPAQQTRIRALVLSIVPRPPE